MSASGHDPAAAALPRRGWRGSAEHAALRRAVRADDLSRLRSLAENAGRRSAGGRPPAGAALEAPREYRTDRPLDRYLTFGGWLHECFGKGINEVVLPVLVGRLAAEPGLRRRPGRAGRIRYDGPFPDRLVNLGG